MKRIILTGVTAMLLLAGCAGQGQSTAMTQPIASAQSQESQSVQAQAPESSQAAQPQTAAGQLRGGGRPDHGFSRSGGPDHSGPGGSSIRFQRPGSGYRNLLPGKGPKGCGGDRDR